MQAWLAGVNAAGFTTYYPMVRELRRVPLRELSRSQRDCGVNVMRPQVAPFLPGLVFVSARADVRKLMDYPGILGLICVGTAPARISGAWIEGLQAREREGGGAIPGGTPIELIFRIGDRVRILDGALLDRIGIVEHPPDCPIERIDGTTRLRLAVELFGRATTVDLTIADIRKI